jgi:lipoyl(octanoyl) transferase
MISVLQLGTLDYATALRLQQRLVELRKNGQIGDTLLLLEHTPVITLGRNARRKNILASQGLLTERGVEVLECDRGGDVTFHGPGQLVGYPIFDLRAFPSDNPNRNSLGAVEYVRRLEEVLIITCADFGIPAQRISGLTGVWTSSQDLSSRAEFRGPEVLAGRASVEQDAKIAAIGIHISRGVTSHGFALNVSTDLSYFDLIVPCGIQNKSVTSIHKELVRSVPFADVANSVARNFGAVFHSQILWMDTLDALLGNSVGVPMQAPTELRQLHRDGDSRWA